jgi:hypothetical protein
MVRSGGAFVAGFVVGAVALTAAPFSVDRAPYLRDVVRVDRGPITHSALGCFAQHL